MIFRASSPLLKQVQPCALRDPAAPWTAGATLA